MSIPAHEKYFAAIDMGTNSFHLIIVEKKKNDSFKIVDRERKVIRLGSDSKDDFKFISPEESKKALDILFGFKNLSNKYKAKIRAVATSAVREAQNKNEFIKTVLKETGIVVEIIEGNHEAKLIFQGAKEALNLHNKKVLCIDIGGGSTEIILGNNGEPIFAESIKIGAVRMSKKYFPEYALSNKALIECEKFIEHQIISNKNISFNKDFEITVGASGTIQSTASIIRSRLKEENNKSLNGFSFNEIQLREITREILEAKNLQERQKIKGIDKKRADILPAGLIILNKIFDLFNLKNITISEYALREGVILEMIEEDEKESEKIF